MESKVRKFNIKAAGIAIKLLCFLLLAVLGCRGCVTMFYPMNDISCNWLAFYAQERNSVDTLIVGSSHAYSSFDPAAFRERSGENVFLLSSNSQNVIQSYFNLKEALKYQQPKRLILETYSVNADYYWRFGKVEDDLFWAKVSNVDGMRFGLTKLQAVCEQFQPSNWAYALFPIARCHSNWADAEQISRNLSLHRVGVAADNAFRPSVSHMSEETMKIYAEAGYNDEEYTVSDACELYFHKLARLCREKGVELILINAPMYDVYIRSVNYDSLKLKLSALAESEQLRFIDCNDYYEQIGLTAQDFEDLYSGYHHLNAEGAAKVTSFVLEELYG